MAILKVARMGNPMLRLVAQPILVEAICTSPVQTLIQDMLDSVLEYDGLGLAAPQVHHSVRMVLLCLNEEEGFEVWINPVLTPLTEETETNTEGCLSVPDLRGSVTRPNKVHVQGYNQHGKSFERVLDGFSAVVAQHECDHLDGVLYVDKADTQTLSFLSEHRRYGEQDAMPQRDQ